MSEFVITAEDAIYCDVFRLTQVKYEGIPFPAIYFLDEGCKDSMNLLDKGAIYEDKDDTVQSDETT